MRKAENHSAVNQTIVIFDKTAFDKMPLSL